MQAACVWIRHEENVAVWGDWLPAASCDAGNYVVSAASCAPCPPGSANIDGKATACLQCSAGARPPSSLHLRRQSLHLRRQMTFLAAFFCSYPSRDSERLTPLRSSSCLRDRLGATHRFTAIVQGTSSPRRASWTVSAAIFSAISTRSLKGAHHAWPAQRPCILPPKPPSRRTEAPACARKVWQRLWLTGTRA